ncbi:MAG: AmmeMemoRadiSam system radical SAM enzyme [Lachnospiraceae bacterium]|nr:AmmeMemoRadiSam system radical SAM enzyme [Lachnospiraceae bacterium]
MNCEVCYRHCNIREGGTGFCGVRTCKDGKIISTNYGKITAAALDPIEKKPLHMFMSGSMIFSIGSYGCNLRCPFCQNSDISWGREVKSFENRTQIITPEEIVAKAIELKSKGNVGIAFTYNEPLIGYEFVRDTARLAKEKDLVTVLVTNGTASEKVANEITPYIDAMNIDIKAFSGRFYKDLINGDFGMVKDFINSSVKSCHVELTNLIIPGENDSEDEVRELSKWIHFLEIKEGKKIPLHITRFFPTFHMTDRGATSVDKIYRLVEVASENLEYVFAGNV